MNINKLLAIRDLALIAAPFPDQQWPPSVYYRFLGLLAAEMQAKSFVELGTCGGGASYNVAKLSPKTNVYSIDINKLPQVDEVERRCPNFTFVLGDSIKLADVLGKQLGSIDLLFVDTVHTYEHTKAEFAAWLPYLKPGSVACFDDLNRSGLDRFWAEVTHTKTEFNDLRTLHLSGGPEDGGFGAVII